MKKYKKIKELDEKRGTNFAIKTHGKTVFHNFTNGKPPFFAIMGFLICQPTPAPWGE
jgi:hypothetical protein